MESGIKGFLAKLSCLHYAVADTPRVSVDWNKPVGALDNKWLSSRDARRIQHAHGHELGPKVHSKDEPPMMESPMHPGSKPERLRSDIEAAPSEDLAARERRSRKQRVVIVDSTLRYDGLGAGRRLVHSMFPRPRTPEDIMDIRLG